MTSQKRGSTAGELLSGAWNQFTAAARGFLIGTYVFLWERKSGIRQSSRYVALGVIASFTLASLWDVLLEMADRHKAEQFVVAHVGSTLRLFGIIVLDVRVILLTGIVLAILVLLYHMLREVLVRRREYATANLIWVLFASRDELDTEAKLVSYLLPRLCSTFKSFGVCGACIWIPESTAKNCALNVPQEYRHPTSPAILDRLIDGKGVASIAMDMVQPCYVPRLYVPFNSVKLAESPFLRFLAVSFPHGLRFETGVKRNSREFDLVKTLIDSDAMVPHEGKRYGPFKSLIAAPLVSQQTRDVYGVLCLHFRKTNTLDRFDVKVVSIIANIIANEMHRIRSANSATITAQRSDSGR